MRTKGWGASLTGPVWWEGPSGRGGSISPWLVHLFVRQADWRGCQLGQKATNWNPFNLETLYRIFMLSTYWINEKLCGLEPVVYREWKQQCWSLGGDDFGRFGSSKATHFYLLDSVTCWSEQLEFQKNIYGFGDLVVRNVYSGKIQMLLKHCNLLEWPWFV